MLRQTTAILIFAAAAAQASAGSTNNLFWLAGEIRGQMAVVRAQADATFCGCREADDVYDELEDLCRRMDRFEERLACPIETRADLRRLALEARRVERQSCELGDAVERALLRMRVRSNQFAIPARAVPIGAGPGYARPGYGIPAYPQQGGVAFQIRIGGLSVGVCDEGELHVAPATPAWARGQIAQRGGYGYSHSVGRLAAYGPRVAPAPVVLASPLVGHSDHEARALCRQMDRLRQLTAALSQVLC
ncbi:hypothetical protein [Botrimarina hoheduenensis]|uniref:Uncharacterized protein n=1 Tax=Botrimarina hoheduenensis TaxID=2528000 RepID=A0A5C5WCK8_9BACT|nr:hypothetical protein [Botrimarina hoheduenensis]TWT48410.1 hypothetical protein Pla111_01770 [Botrimarina hoheduenensis]